MARKSKQDEQGQRYLVGVDALGTHPRDAIIHADDLPLREDGSVDDENIERLVNLGALIAIGGEEVSASGLGVQTLADAVRSDSPPTLPVVPASVDTTPQELALAVNQGNTTVTGPLPEVVEP